MNEKTADLAASGSRHPNSDSPDRSAGTGQSGLSAAHTKQGRLQRALLERIHAHEREGTLPTNLRFLFYELEQAGVVSKDPAGGEVKHAGTRTAGQDLSRALTPLRELGIVPWDAIVDETRDLTQWQTAPTVAEYVNDAARRAAIDRWAGKPAPLILCESRSLAGVLRDLAARYACPIAPTNGQCGGFLVSVVAPSLEAGQRVLYLGDWDKCAHDIEANSRALLAEHSGLDIPWERVALTDEQVDEHGLRPLIISKADKRFKPTRYFDAIETETLGQGVIVGLLRARLDALMPEPIEDVLERQERQRAQVIEQLRGLGGR